MIGHVFKYKRLDNKYLLDTIKRYIAEHGYSPTVRDLARATDTGVGTVHRHLNELIYGGYIKIEQPRRRVIRVVKDYD
jgi:SOS-response transcriptional repressor LexA